MRGAMLQRVVTSALCAFWLVFSLYGGLQRPQKKVVLLKLSGDVLVDQQAGVPSAELARDLIRQMKELRQTHCFGVVVGGGNLYRNTTQGMAFGVSPSVGFHLGMQAIGMNGLLLRALCEQEGVACTLFGGDHRPEIGEEISELRLANALAAGHVLIFVGGTGNPYFSSDTSGVVRALQIKADELWKCTKVDGVYSADPYKCADARLLPRVSYRSAIIDQLAVMDVTAYTLARSHGLPTRVFNVFKPDALLHAARDKEFGSTIC